MSLDAGIAALSGSVEIELDSLEGSFDVSMNIFEDAAFEIPAGENFTGNFQIVFDFLIIASSLNL